MKNPHEKGGIIASVVILVTVLVVGMFMMNTSYDVDSGIHDYNDNGFEKEWIKHTPPPQKPDYNSYYHDNQVTMKCKALAADLQEFSDCVNLGFICVEWDNKIKCSFADKDAGFGSGSGGGGYP